MEKLEDIIKFANEKIDWLKKRYPPTLQENLHETDLHARVQEIYRDCKIILRSSFLIQKQYGNDIPEEVLEELTQTYRKLRFEDIPSFLSWIELTKH